MRHFSLISFAILFIACWAAPGLHGQNLQFSRVIVKQGLGSVTDTVPAGKVWKVENVMLNSPSRTAYYIGVNGQVCNLYNEYGGGANSSFNNLGPMGPLWLSAGTVLQGGSVGVTYTFSIIEFSVTP